TRCGRMQSVRKKASGLHVQPTSQGGSNARAWRRARRSTGRPPMYHSFAPGDANVSIPSRAKSRSRKTSGPAASEVVAGPAAKRGERSQFRIPHGSRAKDDVFEAAVAQRLFRPPRRAQVGVHRTRLGAEKALHDDTGPRRRVGRRRGDKAGERGVGLADRPVASMEGREKDHGVAAEQRGETACRTGYRRREQFEPPGFVFTRGGPCLRSRLYRVTLACENVHHRARLRPARTQKQNPHGYLTRTRQWSRRPVVRRFIASVSLPFLPQT